MLGGVFLMMKNDISECPSSLFPLPFGPNRFSMGKLLVCPAMMSRNSAAQQEAQPHLGVVAEYSNQLVGKRPQGYIIIVGIDKPPFELEQLGIVPVDGRCTRAGRSCPP